MDDVIDWAPAQTGKTIFLTVLLVTALILIIIIVIILASRIKKQCTGSPAVPSGVEAGYVDRSKFRVRWNQSITADTYTVYVGLTPNFSRVQSVKTVTTKRMYADVEGLSRNRTYYIFVSASNSCGESANSPTITFVNIAV